MKKSIDKLTEDEFLSFVEKIYNANYPTEPELNNAVETFRLMTEHPAGSDLIYYPEVGKDGPNAILEEVKAWRAAHGKPGFKQA